MKVIALYFVVFGIAIMGFIAIVKTASSPEEVILGQWSEIEWEYEKPNKRIDPELDKQTLSLYVKEVTGQNLVIHQAEHWIFYPDGTLQLSGEHKETTVLWRIKGRGHLLQLKYDDGREEHYNIMHLSKDSMVIHFEADAQARGIAKLTFTKNQP
jgi:hypothetical protein